MATTQHTDATPASFVGGGGATFAGGAIKLPHGNRGPWTYMANPAKLQCRAGRIVPAVAKIWHQTGISNNTEHGMGAGFETQMRTEWGWVAIPHDLPVVAFGKRITEPAPSTYLRRHTSSAKGSAPVYWTDAWKRPRQVGHLFTWDQDADGRDDWLISCLAIIAPDGLTAHQIDMAVQPVVAACHRLMDRSDRRTYPPTTSRQPWPTSTVKPPAPRRSATTRGPPKSSPPPDQS